jgi:transposase
MFIRRVWKTNGITKKKYSYLHLIESVRTEKGPRQRLVLNLGDLPIDPSQYKALSQRIEDILTGQQSFFEVDGEIEKHARQAAKQIFKKQSLEMNERKEEDLQLVDINSFEVSQPRSLGPEYICHSIWNELGLNEVFIKAGVSAATLPLLESLVVSRLIEPGSERFIQMWAESRSALFELCGSPLRHSQQSYYRGTDIIYRLKEELERHLTKREKELFSLTETMFFFDLTNSYFEGSAQGSLKARYGHSKEKRSDCKLVTLGMIVDELGFSKYTEIFPGNQCEAHTLQGMVNSLSARLSGGKKGTVVMDAGIATEENLAWLKKAGYTYIAVTRGGVPFEKDFTEMTVIREDEKKDEKIEVKRYEEEGEAYILCKSERKRKKEESMLSRVEQLFLDRLEYYRSGLAKKNRTKKYRKVIELIGRLKEKYGKAASLYEVEVKPEAGRGADCKDLQAIDIVWKKKEGKYKESRENEGSYVLRTNRIDLGDSEIWTLYVMLRRIESAFKDMKSHLGLRPNFHQKEERMDAHMFISVLAYHLMHAIEHKLRQSGDSRSWWTIKSIMRTHERMTIEFTTKEKDGTSQQHFVRLNSRLELEQIEIYRELGLSGLPLPRRKLIANQ